ncbi:BON domain-containing protein [Paraburkholderia sp. 1N]|uniref:BON domain-containing protein n=1 Tax=Paraburkholderia solitsugae TaxID=2675748 RepID=A0ABX2BHC0_9BURK|nr:BON domain-containing protein [Paraburkholderia solitsugae]NPT40325.1 BON domain-containing protein [Paraburkholderia solitsugae]
MNAMRAVRCVGGALVVLTTLSAYAQSSSVTTAAPVAPPSVSAKTMRAANRQLQKKVRYVLVRTKGLSASGISVRAYNGAVTLQGWVPDQSQAALAAQTVQGVPGVTSVKSELIVRPVSQ